jgi:hypothetical protein
MLAVDATLGVGFGCGERGGGAVWETGECCGVGERREGEARQGNLREGKKRRRI